MNQVNKVLASASVLLVSACGEYGEDLELDCFFMCPELPTAFALSPESAAILAGDTTTYYTWECVSGTYPCGQTGNIAANWTIVGRAAVGLNGSDTSRFLQGKTTVIVRGMAAGEAWIRVVSLNGTATRDSARVVVFDSSAIESIGMGPSKVDTVHIGTPGRVSAALWARGGVHVRGRPTEWSISDSSVVELGTEVYQYGFVSRSVIAKKTGTVEVRTKFGSATSSARFVVVN